MSTGEQLYEIGESFLKGKSMGASEPEIRTAVNRLYYGILHILVSKMIEYKHDEAEDLSEMLTKAGNHHEPHKILRDYYNKTYSRIMFSNIQRLRGWADYNLSVPLNKVEYTNKTSGKKEWDISAIIAEFERAKETLPKHLIRETID
jgi:hypothetical protein